MQMDVIFQPRGGRAFSVEIGYFDSILEIKEKIQRYQGIPISRQTLVFHGKILQDDGDVESCVILHNSHMHLIIGSELETPALSDRLQVLLKIPSSKFPVPVDIDSNDTVSKLKEKVQDKEGVPAGRLALHLNGNELLDDRSLRESRVYDNSEIDVSIRPSPQTSSAGSGASPNTKKLKLMVLPKNGTKKIPVEMNPSDNVGELRRELQKLQQHLHFPFPQEGYFFIYRQNVMDDDRSFRWHHVCQGDTIEIFNGSVTGGS